MQLRGLLAELTRRVYHLEGMLGARAEAVAAPAPPPPAPPEAGVVPGGFERPPDYAPAPPPQAAAPVVPPPSPPARQVAIPKALQGPWPAAKPTPPRPRAAASLESRIGGQLLNRVGIVALLVGLSYFLKLAFENNWIGPTLQVIIGLAAGLGLLWWSERFRAKGYAPFAYSLKAVGIGALYLSLWAASQYYHLVPPMAAFLGMILVTLGSAAMALRQNSELLAAFALSGGLLTPVLVSSGGNHEIALFSYLLLLDAGTAWMAGLKQWRRLVYGSLGGTAALFGTWQATYYTPPQLVTTLLFLAIFFLLYMVLAARQQSQALAAIVLAGTVWATLLLSPTEGQEVHLLLFVALVDLTVVWLAESRLWRHLLLESFAGTVLLFAVWSVQYYKPERLDITLAFASFFFLLYAAAPFLGRLPVRDAAGSELEVLELVAIAVLNAGGYFTACRLMLEPQHRDPLVWLTLALAALYFVLMRMLRSREQAAPPLFGPLYLAIAIAFLTVAIPLKFGGRWMVLGWLVEAGALFWASHRSRSLLLRGLGVAALLLGVARLIGVDSEAHQRLLANPRFGLYLVAIAALALLAYYSRKEGGENNLVVAAAAVLFLNLLALTALHFEVMDLFRAPEAQVLSALDWKRQHIARDFTYSAVWMLYGSGLMLAGFWKRSAFLRWQGIVLLAATAAKVFFYDIETLERGYRIAAFIVLGAILLAVSFFYQRSRKTEESRG